jgi:hypothetical protein
MSSRGRRLGGRENIGVGGEPPWRQPWSMGEGRGGGGGGSRVVVASSGSGGVGNVGVAR